MTSEQTGTEASDAGTTPAVRLAIEISIRLGAIILLVAACLVIIAPFLGIVVWALIIAIAMEGAHEALSRWLGGRRNLAAVVVVALTLILLIVPAVWLSETLISGAEHFAQDLSDGRLHVPPPDPSVADWPVIGARVYQGWTLASENLAEALSHLAPQLKAVSRWLLKAAGSTGIGMLQLVGSILIAGVMLARSEARRRAIERFAVRMAGTQRGPGLARLAEATVRSVVQGIIGVALIQAMLAGMGFLIAGIPGAGLWALLVLVAAVVQLPVAIVMLPPVFYGLSSIGGVPAILLTLWCVGISLLDNVLKPILFGRGVEVSALVIFMGAIGGMLAMGLVGLFLGAVVLAVGFALFTTWLSEAEETV
jgi:predicted PurR-regulated permease PerM